ncbi:MAG: hypothetical protein HYY20_10315, partial [Candidatus Tectomicrobia bacterium]|nr:hypothetical protein [Candidatus Tectomicrobia bacterium]
RIDAQSLWEATKKKLREEKDQKKLAAYQIIINQIETFRKVVLNPLSHATPMTVMRSEIQRAIDAIAALNL